jgi:hypothetical protein
MAYGWSDVDDSGGVDCAGALVDVVLIRRMIRITNHTKKKPPAVTKIQPQG